MTRPRVALIITAWFRGSHADVLATDLVQGYEWNGEFGPARVEVVSAYLEQSGTVGPEGQRPDVGLEILADGGVPLYPTPAEALGCGAPGVNVDGIVIIGEHGIYEENEYGQQVYPRRRFFDACVSAMIAADRFVPIFNDKHLAWNWTDAKAMYDTARRLGVPLLAGSSIPVAWRKPQGTEWPMGAPMTEIVCATYGPFERYGFHGLEGAQAFAERRAGGETGVVEVRGYEGDRVAEGLATIDPDLLRRAVAETPLRDGEGDVDEAIAKIKYVITAVHRDGLKSATVISEGLQGFGIAATGPEHEVDCELHLQGNPHSHFRFLGRAAEQMIIDGVPPYPGAERTLLTGGILDHAMRNAKGAVEPGTPHLDVSYSVPGHIADTGAHLPPYEHADN
ncbi:hypothetical protein ACQBAU_09815 [Propionibacteriaceae bacterium Y2011]|uniref:hypothetical protein n=1 Tax=Microlunatus sp. Y2014 TaxID=3418488 RepID=UPI003B462686